MSTMEIEVWLYGSLARYGGKDGRDGYARLEASLAEGATMADLLAQLGVPSGDRGITFINGQLSAMPGLQPDVTHVLHRGDRVGMFDLRSMWPFQYRHGAAMVPEMREAMDLRDDQGVQHGYRSDGAEN